MSRANLKPEQSVEEMAEQLAESKQGNRLYKSKPAYNEISAELRQQAIANAIDQVRTNLRIAKKRGRVNLDDVEELRAAADKYMTSCMLSGAIPSMLDFCPSLGHSRQGVYHYISTHGNKASAQFLDSLRSAWAGIYMQLGMTRTCSEATAIFILKNCGQGLADQTSVDMAVTNNAVQPWYENEDLTQEEFMSRMRAYLDEGSLLTTDSDGTEDGDSL